jgi:hypothetical protein
VQARSSRYRRVGHIGCFKIGFISFEGPDCDLDVNVIYACRDGEHLAHVLARLDARSDITKTVEASETNPGFADDMRRVDSRNVIVREAAKATISDWLWLSKPELRGRAWSKRRIYGVVCMFA